MSWPQQDRHITADQRVNKATIPLGNGENVTIFFPKKPMTPDQWDLFTSVLVSMRNGVVSVESVVDESLLPDAAPNLARAAAGRGRITLQGLGVSISEDMRNGGAFTVVDDERCGCTHLLSWHLMKGAGPCQVLDCMCGQFETRVNVTTDLREPEEIWRDCGDCGCMKSVHRVHGKQLCRQCDHCQGLVREMKP
jgi:hypothetical protein